MATMKLCDVCDIFYNRDEPGLVQEHIHEEPQHGLFRTHWLNSGLPYDVWVVETREGQLWNKCRKNRR